MTSRLQKLRDFLRATLIGLRVPEASERAPAKSGDLGTKVPGAGEAERRALTGRAGVVAGGTLASRVLGLGRDQVLAAIFSRTATDAFFVAFTIPNVLRQLLAEGAVQTAVIPVLAEAREKNGEAAARQFFRAIRGLSLLVLLVVTCLGIWAAPLLVDLFAEGYRAIPGQFERTVTLTRWVFPYIFFMGTAALGVAALNTHHRFVVTAFAPALLNVAFIASALLIPSWLGLTGADAIFAMAFGALLGGVLQVVAQWPSLRAIGYFSAPTFQLKHPAVREVLRRMFPVLFGVGVYAIDVTLARRFLSQLPVGSQSYFAFAQRLCDFPQGIFVMALQAATLPSLSRLVARGEHDEVAKTFAFGLRLSLFVGIAASAVLVALAEPLVAAIFQRGAFDRESTRQTANALIAQGVGIWTVAAVRQLVSVYYALGDTRTPVLVASADLCVFIVLSLVLRGPLGHVGVGLAVAGASFVQMLLLWWRLRRKLPVLHFREVLRCMLRTSAASVAAAAAAIAWCRLLPIGDDLQRIVRGLTAGLLFGVVFLLAAWLLKSDELAVLRDAFRGRSRATR